MASSSASPVVVDFLADKPVGPSLGSRFKTLNRSNSFRSNYPARHPCYRAPRDDTGTRQRDHGTTGLRVCRPSDCTAPRRRPNPAKDYRTTRRRDDRQWTCRPANHAGARVVECGGRVRGHQGRTATPLSCRRASLRPRPHRRGRRTQRYSDSVPS